MKIKHLLIKSLCFAGIILSFLLWTILVLYSVMDSSKFNIIKDIGMPILGFCIAVFVAIKLWLVQKKTGEFYVNNSQALKDNKNVALDIYHRIKDSIPQDLMNIRKRVYIYLIYTIISFIILILLFWMSYRISNILGIVAYLCIGVFLWLMFYTIQLYMDFKHKYRAYIKSMESSTFISLYNYNDLAKSEFDPFNENITNVNDAISKFDKLIDNKINFEDSQVKNAKEYTDFLLKITEKNYVAQHRNTDNLEFYINIQQKINIQKIISPEGMLKSFIFIYYPNYVLNEKKHDFVFNNLNRPYSILNKKIRLNDKYEKKFNLFCDVEQNADNIVTEDFLENISKLDDYYKLKYEIYVVNRKVYVKVFESRLLIDTKYKDILRDITTIKFLIELSNLIYDELKRY